MLYEVKLIKKNFILHKDGYPVTLHHKLKFETCNEIRAHAYLEFNNNLATLAILRAVDEYLQKQGDYFKDIHCKFNSNSDGYDANWIQYESLACIECDGCDGVGTMRQVHAVDVAFWARLLPSMSDAVQSEVNSHATMGYFIEDMELRLNHSLEGDGQKREKRKPYEANFKDRLAFALKGSGIIHEGVRYV
jgi:hypothetical protein